MEADESGDADKMAMFADALPTELFLLRLGVRWKTCFRKGGSVYGCMTDLREYLLLLPDCWIFDVQEHSIL